MQLEEVLENYILDYNGCWRWASFLTAGGYGRIGTTRTGRGKNKSKTKAVHRIFYEHHKGLIPNGLEIDHLCSVRDCVNPLHLEAVTHSVNIARGWARKHKISLPRTHCRHSHEWIEENIINRNGVTFCRLCNNIRTLAYKRRNKKKVAKYAKLRWKQILAKRKALKDSDSTLAKNATVQKALISPKAMK